VTTHWQPTATAESIARRARYLATAREFFRTRDVLEVETPLICEHGVTDANISSVPVTLATPDSTTANGHNYWLRTSPEYHMKRLLAAGLPDIYQIGKAFRAGERGARHQPEFTMLEWYRHGFDLTAMIEETCALIIELSQQGTAAVNDYSRINYTQAFQDSCGLNPLAATISEIRTAANQHLQARLDSRLTNSLGDDRLAWLDLLASHVVYPSFPADRLIVIDAYPADQAMLARTDPNDPTTALRFEVFLNGIELANGFHELASASEQEQRFDLDKERRRMAGLTEMHADPYLLDALNAGLPDCSGVAVGLDRLLMTTNGQANLEETLSFAPGR
jgi:lysyl-tRNA synthetase class 2